MKTFAILLCVPPTRKGMAPPTAPSPAATQKDQIRRGSWLNLCALNLEFTSGILCCVHAQDKPISARSCVSSFSGGSGEPPAGRHVNRLPKRKLLDEQRRQEGNGDDRHPGEEDRMEGIGEPVPDANLDRGRQVCQLRGIENRRRGGAALRRLQLLQRR